MLLILSYLSRVKNKTNAMVIVFVTKSSHIFSFMNSRRICNKSNTTDASTWVLNVQSSGVAEFTPVFSGVYLVHVVQLTFSVACCDVCHHLRLTQCSVRLYFHLFCILSTLSLCYLYLFTHPGVKKQCPCQIIFVLLNSNISFCGTQVRVAQFYVICITSCRPSLPF